MAHCDSFSAAIGWRFYASRNLHSAKDGMPVADYDGEMHTKTR